MIEISVNIATHNRAAFLEPCLISLCQQTLDPDRYEICVVNNACTDNTPEIVDKIAAQFPRHHIFMVMERVPGLSRARNCGLRATQGALVANVDDDGTVYPDWLERFLARFAALSPDTAVVGGEIEPVWGAPKPDWLNERMQWFMTVASGLGPVARYLEASECTSECNNCFRRAAVIKAGGFPEELGRVGPLLLSGDQAIDAVIRKNGGKVFFDPAIILRHFIHADRLQPDWLRRRLFWQGVSSIAIRRYLNKQGIAAPGEMSVNLPIRAEDWAFLDKDTPDNLEESMMRFHSLGLVLALTGIIPLEN